MTSSPIDKLSSKIELKKTNDTKLKVAIVLIWSLCVLLFINFTIFKYEAHLGSGEQVLLELAPLDPRGLMQGDYMSLRFKIADGIYAEASEKAKDKKHAEGYAIIKKI